MGRVAVYFNLCPWPVLRGNDLPILVLFSVQRGKKHCSIPLYREKDKLGYIWVISKVVILGIPLTSSVPLDQCGRQSGLQSSSVLLDVWLLPCRTALGLYSCSPSFHVIVMPHMHKSLCKRKTKIVVSLQDTHNSWWPGEGGHSLKTTFSQKRQ